MFKIVTPANYVVCSDIDALKEAVSCKRELIEIDKSDGTYEEGFYKIVRQ